MLANEIAIAESFINNVRYNLTGKSNDPNPHKCEWVVQRNLFMNKPDIAAKIMQATAAESKTEKPVYHFSIDWAVWEDIGDELNKDRAIKAADSVLEKLGLKEHEALYFWHTDADHPHMHVVVNRVNPTTGKAHDMWKSKAKLEIASSEVARDMGYAMVMGRHNEVAFEADKEKGATFGRFERDNDLVPMNKEKVAEVRKDIQSHFFETFSWDELTGRLNEHGFKLQSKGQGLIISDGEQYTQLSKMGKNVRLKGDNGLEEIFGQTWQDYQEKQAEKEVEHFEKSVDAAVHKQVEEENNLKRSEEAVSIDMRLLHLEAIMDELKEFEDKETVQKSANNLAIANAKVRRQEWLLNKAKDLIKFHEEKFDEQLAKIYIEPEQAKERLKELQKEGKVKEAVKQANMKLPRWEKIVDKIKRKKNELEIAAKRGRKNSKMRKQAIKLERGIFYRMQKIREAQGRVTDRENQLTEAKYSLKRKEKELSIKQNIRKQLVNKRDLALQETTQEMIYKSDLPYKQKNYLYTAHKEWQRDNEEKSKEKSKSKNKHKNKSKRKNKSRDRDFDPWDDL